MKSNKEGRTVDVLLQSSIRHDGQTTDNHELTASGVLIEKAGKTYLQFEEKLNGQQVRTTVKLDEPDALIMRTGAVQMRLPFTACEIRPGTYGAGPATFDLLVKTTKLEVTENRFTAHYELHTEDALLGIHEMTIYYTEGNK
ncbi:DUF1934 domain-containing protein [Sporosarcina highlanderae]|uniref:DUF1934 family protein n=1 Tax=Sporosarcina highlanderae TaxID=3035916 RepID=A0ABT8JNR3_9BACL|nr:DUF1934 family protein [Sporosarcina highlanderae]MDN4606047.1 DUF1934 family protein [Sporosarcina highlanderae]